VHDFFFPDRLAEKIKTVSEELEDFVEVCITLHLLKSMLDKNEY
jgi:hypothetical protein